MFLPENQVVSQDCYQIRQAGRLLPGFCLPCCHCYFVVLEHISRFFKQGLAIFIFINKLLNWDTYPVGTASTLIGVFFIGAVQLFFMGILGEYVLSINTRSMKRPLVVVGEKINFEHSEEEKEVK